MDHLGHADARFTRNAYAKAMARRDLDELRALVNGQPLSADEALEDAESGQPAEL
jgi:hypothetical protein